MTKLRTTSDGEAFEVYGTPSALNTIQKAADFAFAVMKAAGTTKLHCALETVQAWASLHHVTPKASPSRATPCRPTSGATWRCRCPWRRRRGG